MKKTLVLSLICLMTTLQAAAWGQMGHDVAAYIGENNLTKKAAKKVNKILEGRSLVYYANWLDSASNTDEYRYTKTWHYRNVDEGYTVETMPLAENGDVVRAVDQIVEELKAGKLSGDEERVAVMMLIHLVGDLHCPMHAGRLSDTGGNKRPVSLLGRQTNLHSLWDSVLIEAAHKWSYEGWCEQLDIIDKKAKAEVQKGEAIEWFAESVEAAKYIYDNTEENAALSYDYISEFTPLVERQLLNAGLRLAYLLNEIYG